MAAGTGKWYTRALSNAFGGASAGDSIAIDYLSDTIKVALASDTPAQDTDEFFSDVTGELSTANGYTAGGQALASKTITEGTGNVIFDAADTVWTASGGSIGPATCAVIYKDTGTASTSPLLGYVTFASQTATDGNTFTITWDGTDGVLKATVS